MQSRTVQIALALAALAITQVSVAQNLNKPADRISDNAINADYETYERQQNEIKLLNDTGMFRFMNTHETIVRRFLRRRSVKATALLSI